MDCLYRGPLPGGGYVIACGRRPPRKKCKTCKAAEAQLECDGCDKPLCNACAVSPKEGIDFCPACFEPAWKRWLNLTPDAKEMSQRARRSAFRVWAGIAQGGNPQFLSLVPLSKMAQANAKSVASLAAGRSPHALWLESGGDSKKYRALLVEHGHLVPKEK